MFRHLSPARRLAGLSLTVLCGVGVLAKTPAHAAPGILANTPWPMFGHNSKHTFLSPNVGPANGTYLQPVTKVKPYMNTQPAVTADGLFLISAGYATWAVRADGYLKWTTSVGDIAAWSSPTIDSDGNVYHGGRDNNLWAKRIYGTAMPGEGQGSEICHQHINSDSDTKSGPLFSIKHPGQVFMTSSNSIYSMSVTSCDVIYQTSVDGFTMSTPSIADSTPGAGDSMGDIIAAAYKYVYRFSENPDGLGMTQVTRFEVAGQIYGASPMIHPDTGYIYIGDTKRHFQRIAPDLSSSTVIEMPGKVQGTAALSPDHQTVYVITHNGWMLALDATTLAEKYPARRIKGNKFTIKGLAPVVDAAGTLYVGGTDKHIRAFNPDLSDKWATKLGGLPTSVAIVPGGLVVGDYKGNVYRFCPPPSGPPTATSVCGFVVDTTAP